MELSAHHLIGADSPDKTTFCYISVKGVAKIHNYMAGVDTDQIKHKVKVFHDFVNAHTTGYRCFASALGKCQFDDKNVSFMAEISMSSDFTDVMSISIRKMPSTHERSPMCSDVHFPKANFSFAARGSVFGLLR